MIKKTLLPLLGDSTLSFSMMNVVVPSSVVVAKNSLIFFEFLL
jgi:hypothetical protein